MAALAIDVRELSFDEVEHISGGPIWVPILVGIGIGAAVVALEEPIKGFMDGVVKGWNDDR